MTHFRRLVLLLGLICAVGCGARQIGPDRLGAYRNCVVEFPGYSHLIENAQGNLASLSFRLLSADDPQLKDRATAAQTFIAKFSADRGPVHASVEIELRDFITGELIAEASDHATGYIGATERAMQAAISNLRKIYHGFDQGDSDLRLKRLDRASSYQNAPARTPTPDETM